MKIDIVYCVNCNYLPRAVEVAADLKRVRGIDATLVKGDGGVFDVIVNGDRIYSKQLVGRFPELQELLDRIPV